MTTLHPGDTGSDVAPLHQALEERGSLPPSAAPEVAAQLYGPTTQAAVETFQAKHGLTVDGIVGPATWAALDGAGETVNPDMPPPAYEEMAPIARKALEFADLDWRHGVAEVPLGSNRGPEVDRYLAGYHGDAGYLLCMKRTVGASCPHCDGAPFPTPACQGAPWCSRFAVYHVQAAAAALGVVDPTMAAGDLASPQKWQSRALSLLRSAPAPGRIGLIVTPVPGHAAHGHVVMIATVAGDRLSRREGNSGNRVAARWRQAAEFAAFVDVG